MQGEPLATSFINLVGRFLRCYHAAAMKLASSFHNRKGLEASLDCFRGHSRSGHAARPMSRA